MSSNDSMTNDTSTVLEGILNLYQYTIIQNVVAYVGIVVSAAGVVSNIINARTFIRMGLEDGVTISFLWLTFADLFVSVLTLGFATSFAVHLYEFVVGVRYRYDPYILSLFFINGCIAIYNVSIFITLYLAIARCMCVARPLSFKHAFTKSRSTVVMAISVLFSSLIYIPVLANMGTQLTFNSVLNATRRVMWLSNDRANVKKNVHTITQIVIPFTTQIAIIICILIMGHKLQKASKFRQSFATTANTGQEIGDTSQQKQNPSGEETGGKMSKKDLQVLQQVVLISFIFIMCNTPMILIATYGMIEPEYDVNPSTDRYFRFYAISYNIKRVVEQVSSSVNFFVYYKYNSKFRKYCFSSGVV